MTIYLLHAIKECKSVLELDRILRYHGECLTSQRLVLVNTITGSTLGIDGVKQKKTVSLIDLA
jgi:hypothetical protein